MTAAAPPPEPAPRDERARARAFAALRRHGWNATSFQVLEPGFRYWFDDDEQDDACVAYVDTQGAWVAAGAPLTAEARLAATAERFVDAARARGRRACFFATEPRFAGATTLASLRIGEQPLWNPRDWETTVRDTRTLREQLRRARAKGVEITEVAATSLADAGSPPRVAITGLIDRWLAAKPMQPMGFLVQLHVFTELAERRFFTATRDGALVGFLSMVPVYERGGWLVEDLIRAPEAPNGTSELLVDAAMRCAAALGSTHVTLGLAPLAGPVSRWLKAIRGGGLGLYDFRGLEAFKAKLRPAAWEPVYLSYPARQGVLATLQDTLRAFARGGLLRFGVETLRRGPAIVVRALALALVPWSLALATADTARWFPSPAVKWTWVAFDVVLAAALLRLARRWRDGLDIALATIVSADAAVTLAEAIGWNLRRGPVTPTTLLTLALAVGAPTFAAGLLWRGRAHRAGAARASRRGDL